ncbi:hypothetical protein LXM25_16060 [Dyadobacter sp. LJ53]|uniref:hypothetical protein n=1 Tax=Dyadobacter chenwenxiniae TaxID=2906456 RepID=UPI001F2219A4|nr:hypothetical protein [Dyadobacter chenwenxiniae]MCF0051583.1 hypothetical protein [Dyadobacter chenwenxiniae]
MKWLLILTFLLCFLGKISLKAQAPEQMNYQAVARNAAGIALSNQNITLRLSVRHDSPSGNAEYSETRSVTTNNLGLFTVAIGSNGATDVSGSMNAANWENGPKFLKVEIDPSGGNAFTDMGSSQLLSVPYSLSSADNQWKTNGNSIINKNSGNVGIGTNAPDASALLDLSSESKGLLVPRMNAQQRTTLSQPATGLLVYQTEAPEGFYYNKGSAGSPNWILLGGTGPQGPQGSPGVIQSAYEAGTAPYPSSTMAFITKPVRLTIQEGQSVFVIASRALGGYFAANELGIKPIAQSTIPGSPIIELGLGMFGLQVPANTRIIHSVNGVFKNLPAGTYDFGMGGVTSSPNWINCEWGYTSVLVY